MCSDLGRICGLDPFFQHGADRRIGRQKRKQRLPPAGGGRLVAGAHTDAAPTSNRYHTRPFASVPHPVIVTRVPASTRPDSTA